MAEAAAALSGPGESLNESRGNIDGKEVVIDIDKEYSMVKETFTEVNSMARFCVRIDNIELNVSSFGKEIRSWYVI